ncbi:MAG: glycoside hydrolase family 9 protein, partial [Cyanobacteria bacterium J06573_11]
NEHLNEHLNEPFSALSNDVRGNLPVQAAVQANAKAAFLRRGDQQIRLTETTAFGWTKRRIYAALGWRNGLGAPAAVNLLRAYTLSEDEKYLQAAMRAVQFSAGANPDNMVFTTGVGDRSPQHPLVVDHRITGQAPPPGITVFGPADYTFYKDYWIIEAIRDSTFPTPERWPSVENYFDIYSYPMGAEFTVDHMVDTAYVWGYLAAR